MDAVVLQGTCGWADQQFPASVKKDAAARLGFFSRQWQSVELNTTTYAVPSPATTAAWVKATPKGFIFHAKAFGLFCSRGAAVASLPAAVRALLPPGRLAPGDYAALGDLPEPAVAATWAAFTAALEPIYRAGKLGVVAFQFHLSFDPTEANLDYVLECRRRLDGRFRMAAEFRCRRWLGDPWRRRAAAALAAHGVAWVAADELEHETFQKDREQRGLPPGQVRRVLPIAMEVTTPDFFYVRVHRRQGEEERQLTAPEIAAWAARIEGLIEEGGPVKGPVYFLWGTDHKWVPQCNRDALTAALPAALQREWRPEAAAGTIAAMFAARKMEGGEGDAAAAAAEVEPSPPVWAEEGVAAAVRPKKARPKGLKRFFSQV